MPGKPVKKRPVPRAVAPPRRRFTSVMGTFKGSEYTPDQLEFMQAIDRYKRAHRRPFPAWSEVLDVLLALGYKKVKNVHA